MKKATLVLVRPCPGQHDKNHPRDLKIVQDGLSVFAPLEVCSDMWKPEDEAALLDQLARYLAELGLRVPIRQVTVFIP